MFIDLLSFRRPSHLNAGGGAGSYSKEPFRQNWRFSILIWNTFVMRIMSLFRYRNDVDVSKHTTFYIVVLWANTQ